MCVRSCERYDCVITRLKFCIVYYLLASICICPSLGSSLPPHCSEIFVLLLLLVYLFHRAADWRVLLWSLKISNMIGTQNNTLNKLFP